MDRIVGGVEIEHDLLGRRGMRLQEQLDQKPLDRRRVVADLVVARRLRPAQLQPVQGALARHRRAALAPGLELARQNRQNRVMAQHVMVIEVFVAQRDPEHPLAHQRRHLVLDQLRAARVAEARRKAPHQADRAIGRAQEQRSGIGRDRAAIEGSNHRPTFNGCKSKPIRDTLWRHRDAPSTSEKSLLHNNFLRVRRPDALKSVRFPG